MNLTKDQKVLLENVLMVVEEEMITWGSEAIEASDMYLKNGFDRVKNSLQHKKNPPIGWSESFSLPKVIGKEVRRARAYVSITSEDIIEVLDLVYEILKKD